MEIVIAIILLAGSASYNATVHHCAKSADGCKAEAAKIVPPAEQPSGG